MIHDTMRGEATGTLLPFSCRLIRKFLHSWGYTLGGIESPNKA